MDRRTTIEWMELTLRDLEKIKEARRCGYV